MTPARRAAARCAVAVLCFCVFGCPVSETLKVSSLHIPSDVVAGSEVKMTCNYDLEGESLFAVRWLKDNQEIFRFLTDPKTAKHSFNLYPGVQIDEDRSNDKSITLLGSSAATSGEYTCEVLSSYHTSQIIGKLTVSEADPSQLEESMTKVSDVDERHTPESKEHEIAETKERAVTPFPEEKQPHVDNKDVPMATEGPAPSMFHTEGKAYQVNVSFDDLSLSEVAPKDDEVPESAATGHADSHGPAQDSAARKPLISSCPSTGHAAWVCLTTTAAVLWTSRFVAAFAL